MSTPGQGPDRAGGPPPATPAQFFDGESAARHDVTVALSDDRLALLISGDSLPDTLRWRLMDLRALRDAADGKRVTLTRHAASDDETTHDLARLIVRDEGLMRWLETTRPNLYRVDLHPGIGRKLLTYSVGAITAVALMLFVILPAMANTLARIIPPEREAAFGKTVVAQMERFLGGTGYGDLRCSSPEGDAALAKMLTRLTENHQMQYDVNIAVFDHRMVNAFAAPGGQVVLLRGLLEKANHPDEVAGVLAHEIGHVEARDATRHSLRAAGSAGLLTMVLGDFTGGAAIAVLGEHMISTSYTRDAEGKADDFALAMLENANVSAEGLAAFFDVIEELQGGGSDFEMPEYLSSHPITATRAAKARSAAETEGATRPVLTDREWAALKSICD